MLRCYLGSPSKIVYLFKNTITFIENNELNSQMFEKAAIIYESVIQDTDKNYINENEYYFCDILHKFILILFEIIKSIKGEEYLFKLDSKKSSFSNIPEVIEEVAEEEEISFLVATF